MTLTRATVLSILIVAGYYVCWFAHGFERDHCYRDNGRMMCR